MLPQLSHVIWPMDEGELLTYPERMAHGMVPHRDFLTFYPPGSLWVLMGAYKLAGDNFIVERAVGMGYRLLIVLFMFLWHRKHGTAVGAFSALVAGAVLATTDLLAVGW